MATIDIIIPVHNRASVLQQTLTALVQQTVPDTTQATVYVVDDCSSEDIAAAIHQYQAGSPSWLTIQLLRISHAGAATARNVGVRAGQSSIILFLGADIIVRPGALNAHLQFHQQNPNIYAAALGLIAWDPTTKPTPLMEWMAHGGPQNDFDNLLGQTEVDPARYFYGSHLSVKRAVLHGFEFDGQYRSYGWEDIDLGVKLKNHGLKLYMLHHAIAHHHHYYSPQDIRRRQIAVGQNYIRFAASHASPRIRPLTPKRKAKVLAYRLSGLGVLMMIMVGHMMPSHAFPTLFSKLTTYWFWEGVWKGSKVQKSSI